MTTRIPLTQGRFALVDDEDVELVGKNKWHFDGRYARTNCRTEDGSKQTTRRMHTLIMQSSGKDFHIDHINRDQLDNRRANLRICTISENLGNCGKRKSSKSPYKGIAPWGNKWRAILAKKYIGLFNTPEEAAAAYDKAAREHFGEHAWTNFPA